MALSKEEFYTFIDRLKITPYNDFYVKTIADHLNKAPLGHKINLNSYFSTEQQGHRAKIITAINFIDCITGTSHDMMPGKKLIFFSRDFKDYSFAIDTTVKVKKD